jgi:hypothetical protein
MRYQNFLRAIVAVTIVALLSIAALADTIRLKDGSIIKGRLTGFNGGKFSVAIGDGNRRREMTFSASEIESIEFERGDYVDRNVGYTSTSAPVNDTKVVQEPISVKTQPKTEPSVPNDPLRSVIKPLVINVNVLADNTANGWTNSGWVVKKGQRIHITADGEVSLGRGQKTSASGQYSLDDDKKLLKSVPTGALIAVIGDDNNDFIYIGNDREFVATRDGTLFLGLNEGNLDDNSGSFKVKIEISPES